MQDSTKPSQSLASETKSSPRSRRLLKIIALMGIIVIMSIIVSGAYAFGKKKGKEEHLDESKEAATQTEEEQYTEDVDTDTAITEDTNNEKESTSDNFFISLGNTFPLMEISIKEGDTVSNADNEMINASCGEKTIRLYYDNYGLTHNRPNEVGGAVITSYEFILQENNKNYLLYASDVFGTQNSQEFTVYWSNDCSKIAVIGSFFDTHVPFYPAGSRYCLLYFDSINDESMKMAEVIEKEKSSIYELIDTIEFNDKGLIVKYTDGANRVIDFSSI